MAYRNKIYIAFDGDNDIRYYWLMKAWKYNRHSFFDSFDFFDAHDINQSRDTSQEESIKRQLSIRFDNSKIFLLLVGESTRYLYKFVKWEIDQAIGRDLPIIVVNLNGKRHFDEYRCPPVLARFTAVHISFNQRIVEHALNNWLLERNQLRLQGRAGAFYYNNEIYKRLGL